MSKQDLEACPAPAGLHDGGVPIPYLACMMAVAAFNALPPRVLPSIQAVEGGAVGSIHTNANASQDLGLMQVNTVWLAPLARFTGLNEETVRIRLTRDPCFNIAAAGAILRADLNAEGQNLMRAVGDYHSHTPPLNQSYQLRVRAAATQMFAPAR